MNEPSTNPTLSSVIATHSSTPHSPSEHNLTDKTLVIFDWDGTLMDSIGLIVESMHVAGEAHGFYTNDCAVKGIIGLSLLHGIDILYPSASDEQKLAIQQSYADYYIPNSHRTPFLLT